MVRIAIWGIDKRRLDGQQLVSAQFFAQLTKVARVADR